jgi:hypothetical protein
MLNLSQTYCPCMYPKAKSFSLSRSKLSSFFNPKVLSSGPAQSTRLDGDNSTKVTFCVMHVLHVQDWRKSNYLLLISVTFSKALSIDIVSGFAGGRFFSQLTCHIKWIWPSMSSGGFFCQTIWHDTSNWITSQSWKELSSKFKALCPI